MRQKQLSAGKFSLIAFLFLAVEVLCFIRFGHRLCAFMDKWKNKYHTHAQYGMMHEEKVPVAHLPVLRDDSTAWYIRYHFISHGGGAIEGRHYTNSLEAWEHSYARGNRVIDADLRFTSDSVLVLRHSWADNIEQESAMPMSKSNVFIDANGHTQHTLTFPPPCYDYLTFRQTKVYRQYTPMSYDDMVDFMMSHQDLYVAADIKGDTSVKGDVKATYQYMVDKAKEKNAESVLDRIIVSCYDYADYDSIMSIWRFPNATMRQHYVSPNNYYELLDFCVSRNIHTVNVSQCYINDPGVRLLRSKGIKVYMAVVDYLSDMEYYQAKGVDGFITNYLYEDMLTKEEK